MSEPSPWTELEVKLRSERDELKEKVEELQRKVQRRDVWRQEDLDAKKSHIRRNAELEEELHDLKNDAVRYLKLHGYEVKRKEVK